MTDENGGDSGKAVCAALIAGALFLLSGCRDKCKTPDIKDGTYTLVEEYRWGPGYTTRFKVYEFGGYRCIEGYYYYSLWCEKLPKEPIKDENVFANPRPKCPGDPHWKTNQCDPAPVKDKSRCFPDETFYTGSSDGDWWYCGRGENGMWTVRRVDRNEKERRHP